MQLASALQFEELSQRAQPVLKTQSAPDKRHSSFEVHVALVRAPQVLVTQVAGVELGFMAQAVSMVQDSAVRKRHEGTQLRP